MEFHYDYIGNIKLLDRELIALFASRSATEDMTTRTLCWVQSQVRSNSVIISGFQSPLEKQIFNTMLRCKQPLIWALGRRLYRRYSDEVREAVEEGRLLIFAVRRQGRTGEWSALTRNFIIADMADRCIFMINGNSSLKVLQELEHKKEIII